MGWRRDRGFPRRVDPDEEHAADWKDAAAYAPLLEADRSIIAWEWLRRDPGYRGAARAALKGTGVRSVRPERWGVHAFERPERSAPDAKPVWSADVHPFVLGAVAAGPAAPADAFDLAGLGSLATWAGEGGGPGHLLISDGLRAIRIDIVAGRVGDGPVRLRYLLAGFASVERPLVTLGRLVALQRSGRFSRSLHPREARARRWLLALRAYDGLIAGADQREIAATLLSGAAGEPRWRSDASSVRSQAQRLVRGARQMAAGGYRDLLR